MGTEWPCHGTFQEIGPQQNSVHAGVLAEKE